MAAMLAETLNTARGFTPEKYFVMYSISLTSNRIDALLIHRYTYDMTSDITGNGDVEVLSHS